MAGDGGKRVRRKEESWGKADRQAKRVRGRQAGREDGRQKGWKAGRQVKRKEDRKDGRQERGSRVRGRQASIEIRSEIRENTLADKEEGRGVRQHGRRTGRESKRHEQ